MTGPSGWNGSNRIDGWGMQGATGHQRPHVHQGHVTHVTDVDRARRALVRSANPLGTRPNRYLPLGIQLRDSGGTYLRGWLPGGLGT